MSDPNAGNAQLQEQPALQCAAGNTGNALRFLEEVKARSDPGRPELYQQVLGVIIGAYAEGRKENQSGDQMAGSAYEKMKELLKDDPDLLEKFKAFLPNKGEEAKGS